MRSVNKHPDIGGNIRKMRELRNYTQQHIANKLGVSVVLYGKMEHSEDINTKYLFKIAAILETSVEKIMNFSDEKHFKAFEAKELSIREVFEKIKPGNNREEEQLLITLMQRLIDKMS